MAASGSERCVLIKIRDQDPLNVSASRLTADSSVFSHLIHELGQSEIEMDDFEPATVILFVTLLEDKSLCEIEEPMFRELHKLAAVFEVNWLTEKCRNWLCKKIQQISSPTYSTLFFLFEECLFIAKRWEVTRPMNLLLSKLIMADSSQFITRYIGNLSEMNKHQLHYLLKLAGTKTTIFSNIMSRDLQYRTSLTDNLRYLLKNINFYQRHMLQEQPFCGIFYIIANLPEISKEDLRFTLQCAADYQTNFGMLNSNQDNTIISFHEDNVRKIPRNVLEAIFLVSNRCRAKYDVRMLVDLLLLTIGPDYEGFMNNIIRPKMCAKLVGYLGNGRAKPVSGQYVDMIISLMALSQKRNKGYIIEILKMIRDNENLTSYPTFIRVPVTAVPSTGITWWTDTKATFEFSSSSLQNVLVGECNREGKCGFLISKHTSNTFPPLDYVKCFATWTAICAFSTLTSIDGAHSALQYARGFIPGRTLLKNLFGLPVLSAAFHTVSMPYAGSESNLGRATTWELVTKQSEYKNSGVHYHEYFCADDVQLFTMKSARLEDGKRVSLPIPLICDDQTFMERVWRRWLPEFKIEGNRELFVDYCIKKFLVAKYEEN